jgi:hypothetical protein
MLDARFPFRLVYDSLFIRGRIMQSLLVVGPEFQHAALAL